MFWNEWGRGGRMNTDDNRWKAIGMNAAYLQRDAPENIREPSETEPYYTINGLVKLVDVVNYVNHNSTKKSSNVK
jgi:hypothetical protein